MIELIGIETSPFVRKVHVALHLKNLDFKLVSIDPFTQKDAVLAINPEGKVPILKIDDETLTDSTTICHQLDKRFPNAELLYPTDRKLKQNVEEFIAWAEESIMKIFGAQFFFQRIVKPFSLEKTPNETLVMKTLTEDGPEIMRRIESFAPDNAFLIGTLSIADITLASLIRMGLLAGFHINREDFPKSYLYLSRIFALPAFQKAIRAENKTAIVGYARECYAPGYLLD